MITSNKVSVDKVRRDYRAVGICQLPMSFLKRVYRIPVVDPVYVMDQHGPADIRNISTPLFQSIRVRQVTVQ